MGTLLGNFPILAVGGAFMWEISLPQFPQKPFPLQTTGGSSILKKSITKYIYIITSIYLSAIH